MSLSIDIKYLQIIGNRFRNFKRKSDYLWNFSCPICGDSTKNKTKARGYVFRRKEDLFYRCHNCQIGLSLGNLLKSQDTNIYKEYVLERYRKGETGRGKSETPKFDIINPTKFGNVKQFIFETASSLDELPENHFCMDYVRNRKIPQFIYKKMFFTENFQKTCEEFSPNHGKDIQADTRLVIGYFDEYNDMYAISGRALGGNSELKYVSLRKDQNDKRRLIYGRERLDLNKRVYIVEGPIDSLFIPNCIAAGSTALLDTSKEIDAEDKVLIYDNQPRNKEVVNLISKAIKKNEKVFIWPDWIEQKDINEFVMENDDKNIKEIIDENTYTGLAAECKFVFWKKT